MGWIKKFVRAGTPVVCAVGTAAWVQVATAGMLEEEAREVATAGVVLTTVALFLVAFVHGVLRPSHHDTWTVAVLQACATALAARLASVCALPAVPGAGATVLGALFLLVEAHALGRAACTLSDALDAHAAHLDAGAAPHADARLALLRHTTLAACLAFAAGAVVLFARTLTHAGTALAFTAGGAAVLCAAFAAAVLVLPRASLPVACTAALFVSIQLAAFADISRDGEKGDVFGGAAAGAYTAYPDAGETTTGVWRGALAAIWDRARGRPSTNVDMVLDAEPQWVSPTLLAPHAAVVAAGVLAFVATVVAGVKRLPGEEEEEGTLENVEEDEEEGCGAMWRRVGAGWREARTTLLVAWPCFVALRCVAPAHPAWVLAQTAVFALGHICNATGYEVHLFPHED